MAKIFSFLLFLFLWNGCDCEYFDDQPKFLTENGNFVIESAVDKNITFRLKGRSYLNINGRNLMSFSQSGLLNQTNVPSSNLAIRLSELETRVNIIPRQQYGVVTIRSLTHRVESLENVVRTGVNTTSTSFTRRIRRLETKVNNLIARLNADNCSSNPCKNGGSYICKCYDAWTGINCDEDVNECANFAGTPDLGCQNQATCENTLGGYNCRCTDGWKGIHCTKRTVDCLDSRELCDHGTCVSTNDRNGFRCICDLGWTSNGTTPACSTDINECESQAPHCSKDPEVPCINLPGSYTCGLCPHGYTGNGHYCKDVDECETNNGGCCVSPFVRCINTRGSSHCENCPFAYTGNGRYCMRSITPPQTPSMQTQCSNPGICHPLATCVQNMYGVSCICPPTHTGAGFGAFGCTLSTSTPAACISNPCLNGGTCVANGLFGYTCQCPPGTSLPRCLTRVSPCTSNPCQNGGTFFPIGLVTYRCTCPSGRTGRNCQTEARLCGGVLNANNGTLKYPLTSGFYAHNSRCAWLIKTDDNKVLNITFKRFTLEMSTECKYDWLQIHDGRSSASHLIGRFCGSRLPNNVFVKNGTFISTTNLLYLWFRSDNSSSHDGFELTWTTVNPVCGGEITIEKHGKISSPGSPGNYPPNRDCVWKLIASPSQRIQLTFFTMQLEAHETCQFDYLAIYNGLSTDDDSMIEKFCNTTHPEPLISSANELTLQFHSDIDGTDAGFQIHYSLVEGIQGCGGTFTATSGEFGSPIQNGAYPKNIECHYLIKLPRRNETKIHISFLSFKMEESGSCHFDYVEIYAGNNEEAPKVGRWCGSQIPPDYTSTTNEVLVVFRSDWSFTDEGFRLKYETVCGGKYEDDHGIIQTPFFPKPYEDDKTCIFDIEAPLGKAIVLNFTDFDIEDDCDFDSLKIYDGINNNGTLMGTYCGSVKPPTAISTMNHMHLEFQTDSSQNGPGFRANYSFIDAQCGGIIKKTNITISPPMSSDNRYLDNAICKWVIVAPVGYLVQLRFSSFDLETDRMDVCVYDYVAVYDNIITSEAGAHPYGKYCGTDLPPITTSTSNALTVVFKTDAWTNGEGFMATYSFIDGRNVCGGTFVTPTGIIQSPNYPESYPPNKDCVYVIRAPSGKQIELNFESFELEENQACSFDSLEIRNGANDKSPLIGTYCGRNIIPTIRSFSNVLYIKFKSDFNNQRKGFKLNYNTATSGCGGVFRNTQRGTISSPNYPEPYPASLQCDYAIQVSRGSTIVLTFIDLDFEEETDCSFDYLAVYDGPNAASKLMGTYCHSGSLEPLESKSNSMFIRFVSDASNQDRGFEIKFNTNCKRTIHDLRGAIESPNFPGSYPHYSDCQWTIVPPMGNRIFIEFSHFDLEHTYSMDIDYEGREPFDNCRFDYLQIQEQDSSNVIVRTDKTCAKMPKPINTTNTVILKFVSDFSNSGGGFHLEYVVEGCGGILTKPEGQFTSPNYPNSYPHNTICQWVIEVDYGHLIETTFNDFDFEASKDCGQDGLLVSNDANMTQVINKFCGSIHGTKGKATSTLNKVYIRFYSDMSYAGRGFSASYRSIPSKCGGTFSLPQGNITSLNYPNNYEADSNCQWLLQTEPSHTISFQFSDFDLEGANCTADVVRIYDGHEVNDDKLLLQTCGSQSIVPDAVNQTVRPGFTTPLKSRSNEMLVIVETNESFESKGFAAQYEMSCGQKITTSSSGILEIGHNLRWLAEDCVWVISAEDPNQHVSLTIMHLENEPVFQNYVARLTNQTASVCLRTVNIYEGTSTNSTKISEICSNKHPPMVVSEGNALTLALGPVEVKDLSFTFDLKAFYSVIDSDCGGEFASISGQIASPGYPRTYYGELDCAWQYTTNTDRKIQLKVSSPEMNCDTDYINIYTGKISGRFRVVRICGNANSNRTVDINSQHVYIEYHTDNYAPSSSAFQIDFATSDGVCGGILDSPNYIFSNPKNGTKYPPNTECEWILRAQSGFHIGLTFPGRFMLESSDRCTKDYVEIYNKNETDWQKMDRICGRDAPKAYNSTGQEMKLIFHTARWYENCGGSFRATSTPQLIKSPRYPQNYPKNAYCNYSIEADEGKSVTVKFLSIDLERSATRCIFDNITIYKPSYSTCTPMEEVATFCRNDSVYMFRQLNRMDVVFRSDSFLERPGFKFEYFTDNCGGNITTPTQIGSYNDERTGTYLESSTCVWYVTAPLDKRVVVRFEYLELEHIYGCYMDNVEVFEGHAAIDDKRKAKLCGNLTADPPTISVMSNQATIKFITDATVNERGFKALILFTKACGEVIDLSSSRPRYTLNTLTGSYEPFLHCQYFINAPKGYVIKAKFNQMHIIPCTTIGVANTSCECDYLNVRDGAGPFADSLGQFCGHQNPPDILSTGGSLYMAFVTDAIDGGSGFSIDFEMIQSPCGQRLHYLNSTTNIVTIESPMNGDPYKPNMNCHWEFTTDDDKLLDIHFERFDLGNDSDSQCLSDYLEISDESTKQVISEGHGENVIFHGSSKSKNAYFYYGKQWPTAVHRYCGVGIPIDYLSSAKTVRILFRSNEINEASGFKFTAKMFSDCSRNYTSPQGRIYGKELNDCVSYISVPENFTITLYFTVLDIIVAGNCTEDTAPFKVYNDRNEELLQSYCGGSIPMPLFTSTNRLRLKFKNVPQAYTTNEVYDITYLATDKGRGCGGELFNYGGTFTSPGYPNPDRNLTDCTWTINVPSNLVVGIQIADFDMGSRATCERNYLEFIEPDQTISSTKFCGPDSPAPYKSKSNQLKVHFKSARNIQGTGWRINFMAVHPNSVVHAY